MGLLATPLPQLTLRPDVDPSQFFDRCEDIARSRSYRIDRRRDYSGEGFDLLNLHLGNDSDGYPIPRMVSTPHGKSRLRADVIARWASNPIDYDEYLSMAKSAYAGLLRDYEMSGDSS